MLVGAAIGMLIGILLMGVQYIFAYEECRRFNQNPINRALKRPLATPQAKWPLVTCTIMVPTLLGMIIGHFA